MNWTLGKYKDILFFKISRSSKFHKQLKQQWYKTNLFWYQQKLCSRLYKLRSWRSGSIHQVTEDFEVAYDRAIRDYKRSLRLRRIQILLRISLVLVPLGVLGVAACLFVTLTSSSPIPSTPRPTTSQPLTSQRSTETSKQPTTTTTAETTASPIQTTAIFISTSTANSSTSSSAEPSSTTPFTTSPYRPLSNYSGKK